MLLAVDVGNSHTVLGLFRETLLVTHWRIRTESAITADELASTLQTLFTIEHVTFAEVTDMVIASVVPQILAVWHALAKIRFSLTPLDIDHQTTGGMKVLIDNPAEVGADRLVNAIAAYTQYSLPLIIVDFGTAITLDCVSEQGDYLGGVIAPGSSIAMEALGRRTAKLPRVDISIPPNQVIGKNTVDAIKSGILFGFGGLVETLIQQIKQEMAPAEPKVIATGGMAHLISPYAPSIEAIDPMLTLTGLRLLHERNHP
ncbi:MAG: type III pantothenate kinase [Proteobacteria bacterium]|nr:type III pantothenate kinase [Pseudomonadota bacterium]MBU1687371.1 type III pantothenate kinase [Pseudomonadota bacterium]